MELTNQPKRKELLYDGVFYDVTEWVKKHPGGKVMEIYISSGDDSLHAVQQFHQRSTNKVMSIMNSLPHRKATEKDVKLSSETVERNNALTEDFLDLVKELKSEGLFEPDLIHIGKRLVDIFALLALGVYLLINYPSNFVLRSLGIFITVLSAGRAAWLGHEGGHHSLTGNTKVDNIFEKFLYGTFVGISSRWWRSQHTRHHAMPQHVKHDVDLQTLPLIAFNKKSVTNPKDGKSFLLQNQTWLFMLMDTLFVQMFWNFFLHPRYVIRKRDYLDLFFMGVHLSLLLMTGFTNFIVITWLLSIYLLGQFSLSHTHMPVTEEPKHWVEYSLTHTTNIRSSWWVDYWMGYLNYQIEHHLFPTMPQFRLKLASARVKALAKKHNLPYHLQSYDKVVSITLKNLGDVSKELARI